MNAPHRQSSAPAEPLSPEVLQSALHFLTAHRPPAELRDLVAALVAADRAALGVTG